LKKEAKKGRGNCCGRAKVNDENVDQRAEKLPETGKASQSSRGKSEAGGTCGKKETMLHKKNEGGKVGGNPGKKLA